ncbi:hypothetical protein OAT67_09735 [Bacteriovoracaceae bacterium]|nr:hypothetical protein [Bacteriovoracaceae bacterium]|tara:strand:- start:179682 stop:179855 length:174 start_codon:yes stop_codon:yes gene_type:complete
MMAKGQDKGSKDKSKNKDKKKLTIKEKKQKKNAKNEKAAGKLNPIMTKPPKESNDKK